MYTDESLTKSLRPQTTGSPRDKYNPTQAPKGQNKGDSEGKEPAEQHYEEQQENELDRKPSRRPRRKSRQEIRQQQQGGEEVGEKVNQEQDEQQEEKGEDGGGLNRQQDAQQSDKNEDGGAEVAQQQDKQGDHKGAFAVTDGQICVPIEMCRAHNVPRMDYVGDSDAYIIGRLLGADGKPVGGDQQWPVLRNERNPVWMKVREFILPAQGHPSLHETLVQEHR
jgi:hypothetical protein